MRPQERGESDRGEGAAPPMRLLTRLCGSDGFRQELEGGRAAVNQAKEASSQPSCYEQSMVVDIEIIDGACPGLAEKRPRGK